MKVVGDYQLNKGFLSTRKLEVTGHLNLGDGVQTSVISLPYAIDYGAATTLELNIGGQFNMKSNSSINANYNFNLTGVSSAYIPECLGAGSLGGEAGKFILRTSATQSNYNYPYSNCNLSSSKNSISYDNLRSPKYPGVPRVLSYSSLGVGSIQIFAGQSCTIEGGKMIANSTHYSSGVQLM